MPDIFSSFFGKWVTPNNKRFIVFGKWITPDTKKIREFCNSIKLGSKSVIAFGKKITELCKRFTELSKCFIGLVNSFTPNGKSTSTLTKFKTDSHSEPIEKYRVSNGFALRHAQGDFSLLPCNFFFINL